MYWNFVVVQQDLLLLQLSESKKFIVSSRWLSERTIEVIVNGAMAKYRKVLEETENVTSFNREFRKKSHCVATYEWAKNGFSYFYPEQIVESNRILVFLLHA